MQHLLEEKGLGAWLISIALTSREQALGSCFSNGAGGGGRHGEDRDSTLI